jgi:hypothetical protein
LTDDRFELSHCNDGKQEWQSHEIYSQSLDQFFDFFLRGYGESKEEAYKEFTDALDNYITFLNKFRSQININNTVDVDCSGKIV